MKLRRISPAARVLFLAFSVALACLPSYAGATSIGYTVSLAQPEQHLIDVSIQLPAGAAQRDLQLPVWNALYQVRDFSQFVTAVRAVSPEQQPLTVKVVDKSRWRILGAEHGATVEYRVFANVDGPYGAQVDSHHAFLNLAEILMYPVDGRAAPVRVRFAELPNGWKAAMALPEAHAEFSASNYDHLVDAPVEIGNFQESDFDEGGGHYRVVVDAQAADYQMPAVVTTVRHIVRTETTWMNDRPFSTYLFLYHFPEHAGGGGMEHANCTAIELNARLLADNARSLADVTAHEFFHLWNVKRIRPQSLEPIDYTRENYTTALWFSEGFTNTVQDYAELQAGLMDPKRFFTRVASAIEELEGRPARLTQSAEDASLDAWLEKYPAYQLPQRSISYYNKGELLGIMLDLQLREASQGRASLRDLFRWMNQNYAKQSRFFPDSEGVLQAANAVSHADLGWFFQKYVAGTGEVPWNDFLQTVGLQLARRTSSTAEVGFIASQNFGAPPRVSGVDAGSEAAQAGLQPGDDIVEINGRVVSSDFRRQLAEVQPGETLRLHVRTQRGERDLAWKVGKREEIYFELQDTTPLTAAQQARRAAWLSGEDQGAGAAP